MPYSKRKIHSEVPSSLTMLSLQSGGQVQARSRTGRAAPQWIRYLSPRSQMRKCSPLLSNGRRISPLSPPRSSTQIPRFPAWRETVSTTSGITRFSPCHPSIFCFQIKNETNSLIEKQLAHFGLGYRGNS
jgi:hypothetical protein